MTKIEILSQMSRDGVISYHHTAWARGYISRVTGAEIREYHGRFGDGYRVDSPSWESTSYYYVNYYVWNNPEDELRRKEIESYYGLDLKTKTTR